MPIASGSSAAAGSTTSFEGLPTRQQLDALVPDRPAYLTAYDGHTGWANSRALKLAGITRKTRNPANGTIVKDPRTGEPTGALQENAMDLMDTALPQPTRDEQLTRPPQCHRARAHVRRHQRAERERIARRARPVRDAARQAASWTSASTTRCRRTATLSEADLDRARRGAQEISRRSAAQGRRGQAVRRRRRRVAHGGPARAVRRQARRAGIPTTRPRS